MHLDRGEIELSNMKSIIPLLEELNPEELIILISLLGMILTRDLDSAEKRALGNLLFVMTSAMLTLASIEDVLMERVSTPDVQTDINKLSTEQAKLIKQFEELQGQFQEILLKLKKCQQVCPIFGDIKNV